MKKVLIVHNKYQYKGGEDIAVENEINFLSNYFKVETLFFSNKIENFLTQAIYFILNRNKKSEKELEDKINSFKPDLIYIHNTWFKASLGIFNIINKSKINTVLKLHNFRYKCTKSYRSSIHFTEGEVCSACGLKKSSMGLFNKYFKESYLKSLLIIYYGKKYFKILKKKSIKIFVLTEFHKKFLTEELMFNNSINIFPNYIDISQSNNEVNNEKYITYAGRISEEKGVKELISSFLSASINDMSLKIIGNGPLLDSLRREYDNSSIEFLGEKSNEETLKIISKSMAVVTATKLYEGQPVLLCEASSLGIPAIFPDTGGIKEFFPDNYSLSFKQFDYKELTAKLENLSNQDFMKKIGEENKKFIKDYLDGDYLIQKLNEIIDGR